MWSTWWNLHVSIVIIKEMMKGIIFQTKIIQPWPTPFQSGARHILVCTPNFSAIGAGDLDLWRTHKVTEMRIIISMMQSVKRNGTPIMRFPQPYIDYTCEMKSKSSVVSEIHHDVSEAEHNFENHWTMTGCLSNTGKAVASAHTKFQLTQTKTLIKIIPFIMKFMRRKYLK